MLKSADKTEQEFVKTGLNIQKKITFGFSLTPYR